MVKRELVKETSDFFEILWVHVIFGLKKIEKMYFSLFSKS